MILAGVNDKDLVIDTEEDLIIKGNCICKSIKAGGSIIVGEYIEADILYNYAFQDFDISHIKNIYITSSATMERTFWLAILKEIDRIGVLKEAIKVRCFYDIIPEVKKVQDKLLSSNLPECFKKIIRHYVNS